MKFLEQFAAANRVSTPLVAVRTFDQKSTIEAIQGLYAEKKNIPVTVLWDAVNGFRPLGNDSVKPLQQLISKAGVDPVMTVDLGEALRVAAGVEGLPDLEDTFFFISNAHMFWTNGQAPDGKVIQAIWNLRDTFKASGCMLVLLVSQGVQIPLELASDILVLEEPLPTEDDLRKIVLETYEFAKLKEPGEETIKAAIDALIGLPAFPAEQAVAMCLDTKSKTLDIKELWSRKRQAINQTPGLSVWEGAGTLSDIGGLDAIKDFLDKICKGNDAPTTILFMDEIEKAYAGTGTDTSGVKTELTGRMLSWTQDKEIDGMIWIGVPGAGKSQLVKNVGATYNIPVINFDLAGMQGSLVGQSGTNLRMAQATVDAISGGRILMIATCNSINALPPELRRRFNLGIFFFDAPTHAERQGIWNIYREKYKISKDDLIPNDEGWTGAEIKECCKKAYRLRVNLQQAANYIVPVTKSSGELIDNLKRSCDGKYLSATTPGVYHYSNNEVREVTAATGRRIKE